MKVDGCGIALGDCAFVSEVSMVFRMYSSLEADSNCGFSSNDRNESLAFVAESRKLLSRFVAERRKFWSFRFVEFAVRVKSLVLSEFTFIEDFLVDLIRSRLDLIHFDGHDVEDDDLLR